MKMILCGIYLNFLLSPVLLSQQKDLFARESYSAVKKNSIYLFCKGTQAKIPIVAQSFNLYDTNSTHVGIGIFEKKQLVIYNVVNTTASNALVKDSISSFINADDIIYCSIWKVENSKNEFRRLRKYLRHIQKQPILFDFMFDLNNGDHILYCSEFCEQALRAINQHKFSFTPRLIKLGNALYEEILKCDTLNYFPVDFFETNSNFVKIHESYFKSQAQELVSVFTNP